MTRHVTLIRHAQASFGAVDYDALSDVGHEQNRALGEALRDRVPRPGLALSGRMRRHKQTAEGCLAAMGLKLPVVEDAGWDEYDHEAVLRAFDPRYAKRSAIAEDILGEDDPARAFQRIFVKAVARWTSGAHDADYAEPWPAFRSRVHGALDRLRGHGAENALVFTSGGPIFVACQRALDLSTENAVRLGWSLANASLTTLVLRESGERLVTFNEQSHLARGDGELLTSR